MSKIVKNVSSFKVSNIAVCRLAGLAVRKTVVIAMTNVGSVQSTMSSKCGECLGNPRTLGTVALIVASVL